MRTCPGCHRNSIGFIKGLWRSRCPACGESVAPKFSIFAVVVPLVLADVLVPSEGSVLLQVYRSALIVIPAALVLSAALFAWAPLQVADRGGPWQNYSTRERFFVVGVFVILIGVLALASFWHHGGHGF